MVPGASDESKNVTVALVEQVAAPFYQDALHPAAQQIGKALGTVGQAVNLALEPLRGVVWGYEKIKDFLVESVSERLKDVPPERITTPSLMIAGPAAESLRFVGHEETLRNMYAELLARSMDMATGRSVLPAFVEVIRQLTPDEALILQVLSTNHHVPMISLRRRIDIPLPHDLLSGLERRIEDLATQQSEDPDLADELESIQSDLEDLKSSIEELDENSTVVDVLPHFCLLADRADCTHKGMILGYVDNLCRLGITRIVLDEQLSDDDAYAETEQHPVIQKYKRLIERGGGTVDLRQEILEVTTFGKLFAKTCLRQPNPNPASSKEQK